MYTGLERERELERESEEESYLLIYVRIWNGLTLVKVLALIYIYI
jgi:hypothetical protein